jgi:uncharacterized protein YnzC (UPF0291/DUF896 family)
MLISEEKLARINELARKSKRTPLGPEEKEEQRVLRAEYLKNFRESFRAQLESIEIADEGGDRRNADRPDADKPVDGRLKPKQRKS